MSIQSILTSFSSCITFPTAISTKLEYRQRRLLAWVLVSLVLFSTALLFIMFFNPQQNPEWRQYNNLIGGVIVFLIIAYVLNCKAQYQISAILLTTIAAVVPWISLLFDSAILQGDFVPLTYITFSILMSSILLPAAITIGLATFQFIGISFVFILCPATVAFNWVSFLAFIFLTSVFSIIANNIIQLDIRKIESLARQLTLNEVRLQELSTRDYLTNLFNRRYMEETVVREIQRTKRSQGSFGVIILDVDKFKHINDTLGHAIGDSVLQEIGNFLAQQIRQSDVACRYGGDEFVLVLPDASREVTTKRAEQLRERVVSLNLPVPITISLGIAIFPENGSDSNTLLKFADQALYRAKHAGGNRLNTEV